MRRVLAVGGTDSSGGAGLAADLRVLHVLGVHASTVVTAVTAQSSVAVEDVHVDPVASVRAQLAAILGDVGADAVKTGMLACADIVLAVAEAVQGRPLVVDPVGFASTGGILQEPGTVEALRDQLLPLATVVTPNLAEVFLLTGFVVRDENDLAEAARRVHALGPQWVLVKGGHLAGDPLDLLYDGSSATVLRGSRVDSPHTHGTGCTLAAALAGRLALGDDVPAAAAAAKALVTEAIRRGYPLGAGPGPVRAG